MFDQEIDELIKFIYGAELECSEVRAEILRRVLGLVDGRAVSVYVEELVEGFQELFPTRALSIDASAELARAKAVAAIEVLRDELKLCVA
jgi:hypothetical protein